MSIGDMANMPSIGASAYGSSTSTFNLGGGAGGFVPTTTSAIPQQQLAMRAFHQTVKAPPPILKEIPMAAASARRLVQVFIADPDQNLPLDKALLYSGEQKFTDATDQELYFEIDIKTILDKHNEMRAKTINKAVKERTEFLEPAKIRELKMVVVTVAEF